MRGRIDTIHTNAGVADTRSAGLKGDGALAQMDYVQFVEVSDSRVCCATTLLGLEKRRSWPLQAVIEITLHVD
jgi:hypothetical protein